MGEVYKARDTRLERAVAIKILPAALAGDPQFRERFDREARAISQLTHPHICSLFDIGREESASSSGLPVDYIVLEHLEGESLEDRLAKVRDTGMPLAEALKVAVEIAGALDTAHR